MNKNRILSGIGLTLASAVIMTGCSGGESQDKTQTDGQPALKNDGCTIVSVATSSEKTDYIDAAGNLFKESQEAKALDNCVTVYSVDVTSGKASEILSSNPTEWEGLSEEFWPSVWSPASTLWTDRVSKASGNKSYENAESIAESPVVFGMPENMAKILGWPAKDISIKDLEKLVSAKDGWGSVGKPLLGDFKVAKTNPDTSTSGLSAIIMQVEAAVGKGKPLTPKDVSKAEKFSKSFEMGAIHYGDTTGNVLETLYENTQNGNTGNYISAIALEEKSLIDYNKGNPTSKIVQPGETLTPPNEKLVAVYPAEGSMVSDNPAVVLPNKWVTSEKKEAAEAFVKFLKTKPAQEKLLDYGFRPVDKSVDASKVLTEDLGVNLSKPSKRLEVPSADTVSAAKDQWVKIRKPSAILQLIDLSGSMNTKIDNSKTRLTGAIAGSLKAIDSVRPTDNFGVWGFTTGISSEIGENIVPVRDFKALGGDKETTRDSIAELENAKLGGTPLYDSILTSYRYMKENAEEGRINAIVVLSDGEDSGGNTSLDSLLIELSESSNSEVVDTKPVRIFTIAYGGEADKTILERISKATGGQTFDASQGDNIDEILRKVMNNF